MLLGISRGPQIHRYCSSVRIEPLLGHYWRICSSAVHTSPVRCGKFYNIIPQFYFPAQLVDTFTISGVCNFYGADGDVHRNRALTAILYSCQVNAHFQTAVMIVYALIPASKHCTYALAMDDSTSDLINPSVSLPR